MSTLISSIIDEAQQLANRVDAAQRDRARAAADRAVTYWAERIPWPGLERRETFYTNGTRFLTFPSRVRQIIRIGDRDNKIRVRAGAHFDRTQPTLAFDDAVTDSTPWEWRDHGIVPTIVPPATDTALEIESTVSESQTIHITGLARDTTASGTALEFYEVQEDFAITGTGVTNTATVWAPNGIKTIEKTNLVGTADVIIKAAVAGAGAGDEDWLARIPAEDRKPSYKRVEFLVTPNSALPLQVDYFEKPERVGDENTPLPPSIDREFMVWRVAGDLHWINQQQEAALAAWRKADGILDAQRTADQAHGDQLIQAIPGGWKIEDKTDLFGSW